MGLEQFQVGYSSLWMFMAPCGFPQRPVFCETPPSPPSCPLGYRTGGQTGGKARDLSRCAVRRGDRAVLRVQGGQRLSLAAAEGRPSPGSVRLSVNPLPPQPSLHWPSGAFHVGARGLSDRLAPPAHCPAAAVEAACCLCQSLDPGDHHSDAFPGTPRDVRYSGRGRCPPECSAAWEGLGQPAVKGQRLSIPVTLPPALRPGPGPCPPPLAPPALVAGAQSQRLLCGPRPSGSGLLPLPPSPGPGCCWGKPGWAATWAPAFPGSVPPPPSSLGLRASPALCVFLPTEACFSRLSRQREIYFPIIRSQLSSHVGAGWVPGGLWGWWPAGGTTLNSPAGLEGSFKAQSRGVLWL